MSYNEGAVPKRVHTLHDRAKLLDSNQYIQVDYPDRFITRITLDRPDKRNAMNHEMRAQLLHQLQILDQTSSVRVIILRGSGKSFCAGYDLDMDKSKPFPMFEAEGEGSFQRNVLNGWLMMMDMAKPIIAQVHGHCLAGGFELASACDIVCVAESSSIGYPPVRSMGLPDSQYFPWLMNLRSSLYFMLTGDNMTGLDAKEHGWATFCYKDQELELQTLKLARRVALIPSDLQQYNKRSIYRAMEQKGMRRALRCGTDLQCLSFKTGTSINFMKSFTGEKGAAKKAFISRDKEFSKL